MTIRSKIKTGIVAGLVGLIGLLPMQARAEEAKNESKVTGDIGYVQSKNNESSYVEVNAFYKLPLDIKGFTFLDFYTQKEGYFGKTSLTRPFWKGIGPKVELIHTSKPLSEARIGLSASIPGIPKGTRASVKVLPLCTNGREVIDNKVIIGYSFGADLPYGFNLSGFGGCNVAAESGPQWTYGELELSREIVDGVRLGYSAALNNDGEGKITPKLEHRVALRVDF